MRRMMDKMGLDMQEMPNVREVLIRTDKKEIILSKPEVTEMKSKDKSIFTITSDGYEEKELDVPIFSDEDIDLVCHWEALQIHLVQTAHPLYCVVLQDDPIFTGICCRILVKLEKQSLFNFQM